MSLFSGILLSLAWLPYLTFCIFFAFVPLLLLEDRLCGTGLGKKPRLKLWANTYIAFLTWNLLVTWWVVYASFGGACMAFIFNTLFMSLVFLIWSNIKNRLNKSWGHWLLVPLWLAWEHGHTLWSLTWTWLSLGNVFAFNHNWVQWYEFTGTSGGTAWALATNVLVFYIIKNNTSLSIISKPIIKIAAAIIVPVFLSYLILLVRKNANSENKVGAQQTIVVQPNIDPYNVKFQLDYQTQFLQVLKLIEGKVTTETDYLVLPETFITEVLNERTVDKSAPIAWFRDSLLKKFPQLNIIVGATTYKVYETASEITPTARFDKEDRKYFDYFNTALQVNSQGIALYHKSKLVPGAEIMPLSFLLKPLEDLALDMGGTTGTLGMQDERSNFVSAAGVAVAPIICYESVYADYVTGYLRNGANLLFIITNDGWWEDTPGHIQHLNYARLRAIESRREIARSANTGISCFIDQYGNISQETPWWKEAVIEARLRPSSSLTFFSRFGDLLSYASVIISLLLVGWHIVLRFRKA